MLLSLLLLLLLIVAVAVAVAADGAQNQLVITTVKQMLLPTGVSTTAVGETK